VPGLYRCGRRVGIGSPGCARGRLVGIVLPALRPAVVGVFVDGRPPRPLLEGVPGPPERRLICFVCAIAQKNLKDGSGSDLPSRGSICWTRGKSCWCLRACCGVFVS